MYVYVLLSTFFLFLFFKPMTLLNSWAHLKVSPTATHTPPRRNISILTTCTVYRMKLSGVIRNASINVKQNWKSSASLPSGRIFIVLLTDTWSHRLKAWIRKRLLLSSLCSLSNWCHSWWPWQLLRKLVLQTELIQDTTELELDQFKPFPQTEPRPTTDCRES